jgi:hypothetical protein
MELAMAYWLAFSRVVPLLGYLILLVVIDVTRAGGSQAIQSSTKNRSHWAFLAAAVAGTGGGGGAQAVEWR